MDRKVLPEFKAYLSQLELVLRNLDRSIQYSSNIEKLTEQQWQQHMSDLKLQKHQAETLLSKLQTHSSPAKRRIKRIRRSKRVRRKNRTIHKRLVAESSSLYNECVDSSYRQSQIDYQICIEQSEIDQLNREDAFYMLKEIGRKRQDLISLNGKVVSLKNYRSISETNPPKSSSSPTDESSLDHVHQLITEQLLQYNKEESYIRNQFSIDHLTVKTTKTRQQERINHHLVEETNQSSVNVSTVTLEKRLQSLPSSNKWSQYIRLVPNVYCESQCYETNVSNETWIKYIISNGNKWCHRTE